MFVSEFLEVEVEALDADFGAGGEIGEALEGEELGGGVATGFGEVVNGVEDGVMDFGDF